MTRTELLRWSGLSGLIAGGLLVVGAVLDQFAPVAASGSAYVSGHILAFFLLTGVYAAHHERAGTLGLLAYVVTIIGNSRFVTLQLMFSFVVAEVLDTYVLGAVDLASPIFAAAIAVSAVWFSVGLLPFALSVRRTGVISSWPGWTMLVGLAGFGRALRSSL